MDDKLRRKLSRTKKALSTSLLVYFVVKEGGRITFPRSRTSNYALKVLRGSRILIDGKIIEEEDYNSVCKSFVYPMNDVVEHNKMINKTNIIVTKSLLNQFMNEQNSKIEMNTLNTLNNLTIVNNINNNYNNNNNNNNNNSSHYNDIKEMKEYKEMKVDKCYRDNKEMKDEKEYKNYKDEKDESEKSCQSSKSSKSSKSEKSSRSERNESTYKNTSRNKDALFSNYLSMILIEKGYQLHFATTKKKESIKEMPFFVWNGLTTPNGSYYSIKSDYELTSLINEINNHLMIEREIVIDHEFLDNMKIKLMKTNYENEISKQTTHKSNLSVFKPIVDSDLYSIIHSSTFFN